MKYNTPNDFLVPLSRMLSGNYWDTEMSVVRRPSCVVRRPSCVRPSVNINSSLTAGSMATKLHRNVPWVALTENS